jgi:hypothetical protein
VADNREWRFIGVWILGIEHRVFFGEQCSASKLSADSKAELWSRNKQLVRQSVRGSK